MAILRPVTKTLISSSSWGVPITDEVNRLSPLVDGRTPTAWTNVAFTNGWSNQGGGSQGVQYRKSGDMVQMRGQMGNGVMGSVAFTLPSGFRPPALFMLPTGAYNTQTSIWLVARMDINADGRCVPIDGFNQYFSVLVAFSLTP